MAHNDETMRNFDEIAEAQGWTTWTILSIARGFIESQGMGAEFSEFAQEIADAENGEDD